MSTRSETKMQDSKQEQAAAYAKVMSRPEFKVSNQTQMYIQFLAMYNELWADISNAYAESLGEKYAVFQDDFNTKLSEAGCGLVDFLMARIQESIIDNMGCNHEQI